MSFVQVTQELIDLIRSGDENAKDVLYKNYHRLVYYEANKFVCDDLSQDDVVGVGMVGLMKALYSFKPEKGVKFATYMCRVVQNEILMEFRKTKRHKGIPSLDEVVSTDQDGNAMYLADILPDRPTNFDEDMSFHDVSEVVDKKLSSLPEKKKEIVNLIMEGKTQREAAYTVGLSQSYATRIFNKFRKSVDAGLQFSGINEYSILEEMKMARLSAETVEKIKKLLKDTDWTHERIGKELDVHPATIAYYSSKIRKTEKKKEKEVTPESEVKVYTLSEEELAKYTKIKSNPVMSRFMDSGLSTLDNTNTVSNMGTELEDTKKEDTQEDFQTENPSGSVDTLLSRVGYKVSTSEFIAELVKMVDVVRALTLGNINFEIRVETLQSLHHRKVNSDVTMGTANEG